METLIAAATNLRDALLIRIPWRTGIRVSELIGIRIQDIDFENRAIMIKIQRRCVREIVRRLLTRVLHHSLTLEVFKAKHLEYDVADRLRV